MVVMVRPSGGICKAGSGCVPKRPKPSRHARFRACHARRRRGKVARGGGNPPLR